MRYSSIHLVLLNWLLFASIEKVAAHYNDSLQTLSSRSLHKLQRKYDRMAKRMRQQNQSLLSRMQETERNLSIRTGDTSGLVQATYTVWQQKINTASYDVMNVPVQQYLGRLDSLQTALSFLQLNNASGLSVLNSQPAMQDLSQSINQLQQQWNLSNQLQAFIRNRRDFWKQQLMDVGFAKDISRINQQVYYYSQQLAYYKNVLNQPDKLLDMAFQYLSKQQTFRNFMATNSQLAQLFRIPSGAPDPAMLAGLQTRSMVQNMIGSQLPPGTNAQQLLQQQLSLAQAELDKLKNKVNELGGGSSELEMPGFKPNQQKTKPFLKRFELGLDVQSQRPNRFLPVTSDIAFSLGYKMSDKSIIGIGVGYKLGWGQNFSNIRFSSEGLSLRSFMDVKIKGRFWVTGGFEYNYQQSFSRISELQNISAWQKSGLVGMTRKYKIGKKEGKLQLLWDFMSYSQVPRNQPLKFRIGYQF